MACSSSAVLPNPASPRTTSPPLWPPRAPASSPSRTAHSSLRPRSIGASGTEGAPAMSSPNPEATLLRPRKLWGPALGRRARAIEPAQRRGRGVVAAHAVRAGAGRRGRRAQEDAGDAGRVGIQRRAGPQDELPRVVGAGDDVAADVVGVVRLHLRGAPHVAGEDPVAEAGCEALDLRLDGRRGVAGVAGGNVRVGVDGVDVAVGPAGVGEVLLADEHERSLGHPPAADLALRGFDLAEAAADMDGAGVP